jgi:cyclase
MLATRVIAVLFLMDGRIVRSERCSEFKPIGDPLQELARFSEWQVDELAYINISRGGWVPDTELLREIGSNANMPLTYGGNITSLEQATWAIANGADKVLIGRAARETPELITQIANKFGSQAVVVSVDDGKEESAKEAEAKGAGEILLHAVGRDGTAVGFDTEAIERVAGRVSLPVVAAGGCGGPNHMADALRAGAHAVAVGNWLHFQERSYKRAKSYLRKQGFNVRWDYDLAA